MAGEVIRDVLIRVRTEAAQNTGTFEAARKQAAAIAGGPSGQQSVQMIQQQGRALTAVERELEKTQRLIREVGEEYARSGRKAGAELDLLIKREKDLQGVVRQTEAVIRSARSGGGPRPSPGPSVGSRLLAGADAGIGALGLATSALGKAAIPVAVVGFAVEAVRSFSAGLKGLSYDIEGTPEEAAKKGLITPYFQGVGEDVAEGLLRFGASKNPLFSLIGRGAIAGALDAVPGVEGRTAGRAANMAAFAFGLTEQVKKGIEQENRRFALIEEEIRLRSDAINFTEQLHAREKAAAEQELQLVEERVRTAQALVDKEQEQLNRSKEAFGLLDAREKQDFRAIAEKVAAGGVDSLSKEEAKFARSNPAIADLFGEAARKSADVNGFAEIARLLGADKRLNEAKEKLSIELDQKASLEVKIEGIEQQSEQLKEELQAVLEKYAKQIQDRNKAELDAVARRIVANMSGG